MSFSFVNSLAESCFFRPTPFPHWVCTNFLPHDLYCEIEAEFPSATAINSLNGNSDTSLPQNSSQRLELSASSPLSNRSPITRLYQTWLSQKEDLLRYVFPFISDSNSDIDFITLCSDTFSRMDVRSSTPVTIEATTFIFVSNEEDLETFLSISSFDLDLIFEAMY